MSPTFPDFVQAVGPRFVEVLQSVVSPGAAAADLDGTVTPGWLVPCELGGSLTGTCYFALTAEDATGLAGKILMKDDASPAEISDSLKEVLAQAVASVPLAAPFTALTIAVGKPVTAPVAPGTAAGGFACVLDDTATVRIGCSYAGGATAAAPTATVAAGRGASAPAVAKAADNLDLILGIEMPLTVRFGEAVLTLDALGHLAPGSLVELSRQPDDPVEILINGRLVARGQVVVVSGNYGVRVTEVASALDRLSTLNA